MNRRLQDALFGFGYWGLILLGVAFLAAPVVVALILSFDARSFIGPFPPQELSLRWYREFLSNPIYRDGLRTSLIVSGVATAVSTATGALAAVALERGRFPGRSVLQALFLSPLVIPTVVIGFGMLLFASRIGVTDGLPRLIMGHVIITFPYVVRATTAALVGIRPTLNEAALSLGATPRRALWRITLPLARTGIITGAVFAFVMSFDEIAVSLFLSDPFTFTLPVALLSQMRASLNLTVAAVSAIFLVATLLLILLLDRLVGLETLMGQGVYRR